MAKVLLKDIAQKMGLTVNTISRALKDKSDISLQTRIKVKEIASEMGYIPNSVASSLRQGYTNTIGIVFDNIANYYFMIMTELIHSELTENGFEVMIFTCSGESAQFDIQTLRKIASRQIDGIITFLRPTIEAAEYVKKNKFPMVVIGREGDDLGVDSVYTNDFNGGFLVGEHLNNNGHKNVAYIGAPSDIKCSTKRYEGLKQGLGIKTNSNITLHECFLEHNTDNVENYVSNLIEKKVTAIFCFNDSMAYEAIKVIENNGLRVPLDIAVIGYDDIEERSKIPIDLTTVHTDKKEITKSTVKFLKERILDFDKKLEMKIYEPKLIVRKTG